MRRLTSSSKASKSAGELPTPSSLSLPSLLPESGTCSILVAVSLLMHFRLLHDLLHPSPPVHQVMEISTTSPLCVKSSHSELAVPI